MKIKCEKQQSIVHFNYPAHTIRGVLTSYLRDAYPMQFMELKSFELKSATEIRAVVKMSLSISIATVSLDVDIKDLKWWYKHRG
jgi:hypothetical protein